jgi:hypothetical protein
MAHDDPNDSLSPSAETTPPHQQSLPSTSDEDIPVPEDVTRAGHDTNESQADSPESLDQDISEGTDRERIDPHHSATRINKSRLKGHEEID